MNYENNTTIPQKSPTTPHQLNKKDLFNLPD